MPNSCAVHVPYVLLLAELFLVLAKEIPYLAGSYS